MDNILKCVVWRYSALEPGHRLINQPTDSVMSPRSFGTKVIHLGQKRIGEKRDLSFTVLRFLCAARKPIFTVKLQHGIQLMTNIRIVACFGLFSGVFV